MRLADLPKLSCWQVSAKQLQMTSSQLANTLLCYIMSATTHTAHIGQQYITALSGIHARLNLSQEVLMQSRSSP